MNEEIFKKAILDFLKGCMTQTYSVTMLEMVLEMLPQLDLG
jgi:hypothetical protein